MKARKALKRKLSRQSVSSGGSSDDAPLEGKATAKAKKIVNICNKVTPIASMNNKDLDYSLFKEKFTMDHLNHTLDFLMPL